jgi:flavin-dependent dehydrogenase
MAQGSKRRNADRIVLVGDAAGFVDSISGDGLSIAFNSALILGKHLRSILARGATGESMQAYEREGRRLYRGYWFVTKGLLTIARHPRARRMIINSLMRHPEVFRAMMAGAMRMMVSAV